MSVNVRKRDFGLRNRRSGVRISPGASIKPRTTDGVSGFVQAVWWVVGARRGPAA